MPSFLAPDYLAVAIHQPEGRQGGPSSLSREASSPSRRILGQTLPTGWSPRNPTAAPPLRNPTASLPFPFQHGSINGGSTDSCVAGGKVRARRLCGLKARCKAAMVRSSEEREEKERMGDLGEIFPLPHLMDGETEGAAAYSVPCGPTSTETPRMHVRIEVEVGQGRYPICANVLIFSVRSTWHGVSCSS